MDVSSFSQKLKGKDEAGNVVDITAPELRGPLGMFGEYRVSEGYQVIELKSTYGLSALRDVQTVVNTGAISNSGGEYNLSTGTTTGSSAQLESAERGRYIPGVEAQCGIGIRLDETFTGTAYAEWGYFDGDNGFGYGKDATGVYIFYLRAGSQTKVYQSNWNIDMLDGTGASGVTLDPAKGVIYEIDFTWYGYGSIEWKVIIQDTNTTRQYAQVVHRFNPNGQNSVQDPNLPIRVVVDNGGTTTDYDINVGGRQFTVFTQYSPNFRVNGDYRLSLGSVGTTFKPLVSFKRKTAFQGVSLKVDTVDLLTDQSLVWELRLNAGLTAASYGTPTNVSASETAVEVDKSATALTGGEFLGGGLISATGAGSNAAGAGNVTIGFDIPDTGVVTLCARTISGTATISSFLKWREEW